MKVTVTIPEDLLDEIRAEAAERGLSAYVAEALRFKRDRDQFQELVGWLQEEHGPLSGDESTSARDELEDLDLDREALSLAVRSDREMIAWFDLAARGEAEVVTSPMTLVEAYDGRTAEQRWDWVLSRPKVTDIGKDEARQASRLLADAELHSHTYAIDALLAVIARRQKGQVTVFTSDGDDLEKLGPDTIVVRKV